jgi:hypothetical protein
MAPDDQEEANPTLKLQLFFCEPNFGECIHGNF